MMAHDAHLMEQMSEEEILECLVAETGPQFTVRISVAWMHSMTSDSTQSTTANISSSTTMTNQHLIDLKTTA